MNYLILFLICGLPFSAFLFPKLDIWHAHGHFFQVGLLILLGWSFFEQPKRIEKSNKPLGLFVFWAGVITAFYWFVVLSKYKEYPIILFFPFFNLLCFVFFYNICTKYLTVKNINQILLYLSYTIFAVVIYSILQICGLDQFYKHFNENIGPGQQYGDQLVGTIGNTTHLAGYLAICQPIFFKKTPLNIIALILLWFVIIMTKSASGLFIAIFGLLFWLTIRKHYKILALSILFGILGLYLFKDYLITFCDFSGRLEVWKILLTKFQERPITGWGIGILNAFKIAPHASLWKHAHQEYLQIAVELGIVGLAMVLWCIVDYTLNFIKLPKTNIILRLTTIFYSFILLGLFSFPTHLWLIASMGMLSYTFPYIIKEEYFGDLIRDKN